LVISLMVIGDWLIDVTVDLISWMGIRDW
jgi:hypothetical protein